MYNYKEIWESAQKIDINDLPKHSHWISKLLRLEEWKCPARNEQELFREYEQEKFGKQISILEANPLASYSEIALGSMSLPNKMCCCYDNEYRLLSYENQYKMQLEIIYETLVKHLPASALIELGSGNGRIINSIASRPEFKNIPAYALEFMPSGRKITEIIATRNGNSVQTINYNGYAYNLKECSLPENAIVFTSHFTYYLPELEADKFINDLLAIKPLIIVHFEPFFSSFAEETLFSKLALAYMKINNYGNKLDDYLFSTSKINIVANNINVFGSNPLLPFTILEWNALENESKGKKE